VMILAQGGGENTPGADHSKKMKGGGGGRKGYSAKKKVVLTRNRKGKELPIIRNQADEHVDLQRVGTCEGQ